MRLTQFEPSPTLVISPAMKATVIVHPREDRPISVGEYLRVQGFPDGWKVANPAQGAKAIARAVRGKVVLGAGNPGADPQCPYYSSLS